MLARIGQLAAVILSISALPSLLAQNGANRQREQPLPERVVDRFDALEYDGSVVIFRSPTGPYKHPDEFPLHIRKMMQAVPEASTVVSQLSKSSTTFVVSDPSDASDSDINDVTYSPPTLRSAIENANKLGGSHVITFSSGLTSIQPATNLPGFTGAVSIDGAVAAGKIILDGSLISNGNGLFIKSNSVVQNISFQNWGNLALALGNGTTNNVVKKCEFKNNGTGININSTNTTIGGDTPEDGNVAGSNSQSGVSLVFANDITVKNNMLGTLDGITPSPNTYEGLYVLGNRARVIHNVLSGNNGKGIGISELSSLTLVQDNIIGLDSSGRFALGNYNYGVDVMGSQDSILNNVISANGWGIIVSYQADQTFIQGNIIGPNKALDSLKKNNSGGIYLVGTPVTVDSNIISGNNWYGININGYGGATVKRNMIGTDHTGTLDWGNDGAGVNIVCDNNIIGGPLPSDRNIISGNTWGGIEMFGGTTFVIGGPSQPNYVQGNVIRNNIIGTDITGTVSMSNFTGLFMNGYIDSNDVRDNLISGNRNHGIWTRRNPDAPSRNTFQHNRIGTTADGLSPLPNDSCAMMIDSADVNLIGGPNEADANIIAFSNQHGIAIKAGWGTQILRNSIFENKGMAIDLGNDGPTPNDSSDSDLGPNRLQNFPRITWLNANGGSTTVKGRLQSRPLISFRLEFYTNDAADSTGFGEAKTFQVSNDVVTDSAGNAPFEVSVPGTHGRVVGTATDPDYGTSEVSKAPFVVNSTADRSDADPNDGLASTSGPQVNGMPEVTLRSALQASNHIIGEDDITFNIPGGGAQFINPQSQLSTANGDVTIDGTTQPGFVQGAVQIIQVLGSNAGPSSHGLRLNGDHSTVRGLYISAFRGNGIEMSGDHLVLGELTANNNKGIGVHSSHNVMLDGELIVSGNGPASPAAAECDGIEAAGLKLDGVLTGKGKITASANCGPGIYQTSDGAGEGGIDVQASVTASGNAGSGVWANADITLRGEQFEFNSNGAPKKPASGIRAGVGNILIIANGEGLGANIRANNNSRNGINCDLGSIDLRGRAQANNNGAGLTVVEAFNKKVTGIWAEGDVRAVDVEVKANGLDGIKASNSIIIEGNVTASNHYGRGLWGVINVIIEGENHLIENNRDGAIWAANGFLRTKGTLVVRNNTVGGHHSDEESINAGDALVGAVHAVEYIRTENITIENNTPSGIVSWGDMVIDGNAIVRNNAIRGIHAHGFVRIFGESHNVSGNQGDGIISNNEEVVVNGHIILDNNGGFEDDGYGIFAQMVRLNNVTARGNKKTGVESMGNLTIMGRGMILGNLGHGLHGHGIVSISGGKVSNNAGIGIAGTIVRMSGTEVSNNGGGGVAGQVQASGATAVSDDKYRSRFGILERWNDGIVGLGSLMTAPALSSGVIRGSSITGNGGDGVLVDSPYPYKIEGSNISGNTGFGVKNAGGGTVTANANWWGSAAGPGAAVNGVVAASSWQSSAVGVYVGVASDSVYVLPGDTGTISLVAANWSAASDSLLVDAADSRGWLTPVAGRSVVLKDSVPAVTVLNYTIPGGASIGDTSRILVSGASQTSPANTGADTLYFVVYTPTLHEIFILSDTVLATPGDTVQFTAVGVDQTGRDAAFSATWTSTGGMIDTTGRLTVGPDTGLFIVRVADTAKGLKDSAYVRVVPAAGPATPGTIAVTSGTVYVGAVQSGQQLSSTLGITNTSGGLLRIDSLHTHTAYFGPVWDPTINLIPVGDTLSIGILFMPDSIGAFTDTLFVYNNSATSPVKVPISGNGTVTGVPDASTIPTEFVLQQNFPNPFNPSTTIRFGIPHASHVSLRVYDLLGREVVKLVDGVMNAGYGMVEWRGNSASGTYFYRIEAVAIDGSGGRFVETRRMVLVR